MLKMTNLTDKQRDFLEKNIKKSAGDLWEEELVRLRGIDIGEEITLENIENSINQWILVETKDGGEGLRPYKCLCGHLIRYQFIVKHRTLDITHKLGSECIKKYTGIDSKLAKKVLVEKKDINNQVEEIIRKIDTYDIKKQLFLLDYEKLPAIRRKQLELGIPLTDRQLNKVFKLLDKSIKDKKHISKDTYDMLTKLKEDQLAFINSMSMEERQQLIVVLKDGKKVYSLEELKKLTASEIALREKEIVVSSDFKGNQADSKNKSEQMKLIKEALKLLDEDQKQFWGTRMSLNQRIETARYIIDRMNIVKPYEIRGKQLDSKLRQQIYLGLPLTQKQMETINSY